MKREVRVGLGVIVQRKGAILLGRRKNAHGEGCWAPPGGHLEFGESFEECAARELMEETGLQSDVITYRATTNDIFSSEGRHYVTIFMVAHNVVGDPTVCEPEKCEEWEWFAVDKLPNPLFAPLSNLMKNRPAAIDSSY